MKKVFYLLTVAVFFVLSFSNCAKFPEDEVAPPQNQSLKIASLNAPLVNDTIRATVGVTTVFTAEIAGNRTEVDFDFNNGTPIQRGSIVSTKFNSVGIYTVKAIKSDVTPNLVVTRIVKVQKDVIIVPQTGDGIIIISSTYNNGTNNVVFGLKAGAIGAFDPATPVNAEVQFEMKPSISWTKTALPASSITTINGVKYYQWSVAVPNNQKLRFGWLIGDSWAYDPKSPYRQADGLYIVYVNNGVLYKEVVSSVLPGTFGDTKVRGDLEIVSSVQNLVLYVQKLAFTTGTPSLKVKIGEAAEQVLTLVDAGDYLKVSIPLPSGGEVKFWPQSTVGSVVTGANISDSIMWNTDSACGRLQIINLKSAKIGDSTPANIIFG